MIQMLQVRSSGRTDFIDITDSVQEAVQKIGGKGGDLFHLYPPYHCCGNDQRECRSQCDSGS